MVRMAEWSKALGVQVAGATFRSQSTTGWVRIPLLTKYFRKYIIGNMAVVAFLDNKI